MKDAKACYAWTQSGGWDGEGCLIDAFAGHICSMPNPPIDPDTFKGEF